jgi:uncharacterized phage protein gp47/JayE
MPLADLPSQLLTPTRAQEVTQYASDYGLRNPSAAPVVEGSLPYIDGQVLADQTATIHYNSVIIANAATRATRKGNQLDNIDGVNLGCPRNLAAGASGFVVISAAPSGTTIVQGDVCTINGFSYECSETGTYADGQPVPVTALATGYGTNQPAGATGTWSAPRPGCFAPVTVFEQSDASGLTDGAPVEDDVQYIARLDARAANPPASGNDAQYQFLAARTPGLAVQQGFTYPAAKGSGSTCLLFLLRPAQPGAPRIPNATQIQAVLAWIQGQMPASDGLYMGVILPNPIDVHLEIEWQVGAQGWVDQQPWPPYVNGAEIAVDPAMTATATSFYLTGNNGTNAAPVHGQTIAMFDIANLTFHPKRILTVTPVSTDWLITVDTTSGVSDTSYVPFKGQVVCPWSASLQSIVLPVISYFDTLGPGEQLADADFIDPGLRQRRSPPAAVGFPAEVGNRLILPVYTVTNVGDVALLDPTIPYAPPIGSPGVSAYLNVVQNIAVFPEG